MSPSILLGANGRAALVAGASGGPLIISATLWAVLGVVAWGEDVATAVAAPRAHHQLLPPLLFLEGAVAATCAPAGGYRRPDGRPAVGPSWGGVCEYLVRAGHRPFSVPQGLGQVQAVAVGRAVGAGRVVAGSSDPRKLGKAAAY